MSVNYSLKNRKSHTGFRLVYRRYVTLNDLEQCNIPYSALFHRIR